MDSLKKAFFAVGTTGLLFLGTPAAAAQEAKAPSGPPPFMTYPVLTHVPPAGLDHGHFVFTEGGIVPSPLGPSRGAAEYSPATQGSLAISSGTDRDVSNAPDSYEGETGAAARGGSSPLLVGGSNHIFPGACSSHSGGCFPLAYASVNGAGWTSALLPATWPNPGRRGGETTFGIGFDPGIDYDKNGTFYFSYGVAPLSGSYPNAIVVVSSTDGTTWTKKTPVTFNKSRFFDDKYYIAVDRSSGSFSNRIYVSWDRNTSTNQILYIAYSSDGGNSWSSPVKVNDGTSRFERVIGAYPAVDQSTGVVYDSWHDYAQDVVFVDTSTNGGATWGTDVAAATTHTGFGVDIGCVGGRSQGPAHALKVGPSGALYLVYADSVLSRGFDILLTKSTNGGATWSAPVTLNDDSGSADQFHPTLSVESTGSGGDKVTVSFYDRRDDPANCSAHVYATQSADSGTTWSANVRQTSASSDFDGNPNGPGDYSSSIPFGSAVWPFFSDHRSANPETATGGAFDIYTVNVQ